MVSREVTKNRLFSLLDRFSRISFEWYVVRFWFLHERKDMIQGHFLDTLNMVSGCVENFSERSEKQNHLQKRVLSGNLEPLF